AGTAIALAPAPGGLAAVAYPVKSVEGKVDENVTGGVQLRSGKQIGSVNSIDSDLSLLDDLFADISLLP
ncbi:MAG: hypothetical protein ACKO2L_10280, partial [Planctomycetaceae bacterium]